MLRTTHFSVTSALVFLALMMLPIAVFAGDPAGGGNFGVVNTFAATVIDFINGVLIPLIFAIALLVFIWGMFTYFILGGGDEGKREQGKSLMLWAIIGFVLMIVIFAIVNLLAGGLLTGLNQTNEGVDAGLLPSAGTVQ
jgi:hypothetical protein